eukprot:snap_masked-scaffold1179_size56971-processed-gene-0.5 protein:Tk06633 transcript:snap_masked-scaffold1179_size56971-processed-gene-0.5-mRNA-1 annotation:"hypothetical protein SINV_03542"
MQSAARNGDVIRDVRGQAEYRILDYLGEGGFGTVYQCRAECGGSRMVAIKRLDKARLNRANLKARVVEEVRVHARLEHPSILSLYHVFEDEAFINLVLEYCPRGDLTHSLKTGGRFDEAEARHLVVQVAEGLQYLHKHNILHRDITMSNIMITEAGRYKIGDFGLAKSLSTPGETHRTLCGTPNAISPEVALKRPYGLQADVWGLGVILYTVLVGQSPFDDGKVKSTLQRVIAQNPEFPPHLSPNAVHLITGMLQKDEAQRLSLAQVMQHPFLHPGASSTFSNMTGDSGIGTTTLTNQSQNTLSRRGPDIRQPLLGHLSEVTEDVGVSIAKALTRPRSATPHMMLAPMSGMSGSSRPGLAPHSSWIRPRSQSIEGRSQSYGPSNTTSKPTQPLCPPCSTLRLRATRSKQVIKPGITGQILSNGSVAFEFELVKRNGTKIIEKLTVSPDGLTINVDRMGESGESETQEYKHYTLPRSYWVKYSVVCRFVQCVQETTPKITLYAENAHCYLMENRPVPNFEAIFQDGPTIAFQAKTGKILFQYEDMKESFSYPLTKSIISEDRLRFLKHFEECHSQCKTLEKLLSESAQDISVVFPATFGRRNKSLSSSSSNPKASSCHREKTTFSFTSNFSPSSAHAELSKLSCVSKQSIGRGSYREYRFADGSILQIPKDSRDEICYYMNTLGQWENNEFGPSTDMKEKIIQAMKNNRSARL